MEGEAKNLSEEVSGLSERNRRLVDDLSETLRCQEELKKLNKDLLIKAGDATGRRLKLIKELEEGSQQFESLNLQYTEKEGIPSFVHFVLNSGGFGDVNAALQTVAIQLGLHHACIEMKARYP
ncbi:unnamed protein product [Lactuca virosa]|uniref:Uncharacterized protein n=1 Tax=Lactuca virosa TaxID=75947 RepID=A0AAU9P375_9ASTR|nr:unnamed protein product [Lactuca virosa]